MRRGGWLALVAFVLLLAVGVAAGLLYIRTRAARELIRAYLETTLSHQLELPVRLDRLRLSPRLGRVQANRAALLDPETGAPLIQVERLQVTLDLWPLLRRELRIRSVRLSEPRVSLEDSPRLRAMVLGLLDRLGELARDPKGVRFPLKLTGGTVRYRHPASGVVLDADGLELSLAWPDPERAVVALTIPSVSVSFGGRRLERIRVEGNARIHHHQWHVSQLKFERGGSALSLQGVVANLEHGTRAELVTTGALALSELAPLLLGEEGWKGKLSVGGKLSVDRVSPAFDGTLRLADAVVRGLTVTHAQASVSIRPEMIEVIALNGQVGGGTLSGLGLYELGSGRYRGRLELKEVTLPAGLRPLGWIAGVSGQITGSLEGSGQGKLAQALSLQLNLSARGLRPAGGDRGAEGRLVGRAEGGVLKVERLTFSRGGSQASARGSVSLATEALALTVSVNIADLAQDLWPRRVGDLGGRLRFSGQLSGRLSTPAFSGQVKGEGLSFRSVKVFDSVDGPLEVGPSQIASRGLKLVWGRSIASLSGEAMGRDLWRGAANWQSLTLALTLKAKGRAEDLAKWIPGSVPLGGSFVVQLSASGSPTALTGRGQLEARELQIGPERLESVQTVFDLKGSELVFASLTARRGGMNLSAEGGITLSGRYRFTLAPVVLDLAQVVGSSELSGKAVLRLRGTGELFQPQVEGDVALADTAFRDLRIGNGRLHVILDGSQWRWELGLDAGVRAQGSAPLALDGSLRGEVSATDLDLTPYLRALRRQLPFPLTVRADGSARLIAQLPGFRDLRGHIELTRLRCQAGDTPCQLRAPAAVTVETGTLRFDALELVGPGLSVSVKGSVRPGERTELNLRGHAPFPLLEWWVPPVTDLRGTPNAQVTLTGSPGQLRVTGRAELRGVEVRLKQLPLWLTVASGEVTFSNDGVEYVVRQGAAGGGRLEGRGSSVREGTRWSHSLELRLDKARLDQLYDHLQIGSRWASGDLVLRGSLSFETSPELSPLQTLAGSLSVTLEGGSLSSYPGLARIFGLLTSPAQPRLPDLTQERMPYRQISADFTLAKGVMETTNLVLDSEVVQVSGVGKVQVPEQTVEFDLAVRPLQALEGGIRKVPVLRRLLPQSQGLAVVYFKLEGPWDTPTTSLAPVKSLSQTVVDLLLFLLRAPDRLLIPQ